MFDIGLMFIFLGLIILGALSYKITGVLLKKYSIGSKHKLYWLKYIPAFSFFATIIAVSLILHSFKDM